jgi:uncharacterized oxidoreductase
MIVTGNTILITGGASGIGRALAEAFHRLGNSVVIAGRGQAALDEVAAANPGMAAIRLDIGDAAGIEAFAAEVVESFPGLNVLINNAGIMEREDVKAGGFLATAEATIATNLLGPIRLTGALLPHLLEQPRAAVLTVSSGLAFVPLAATPTYSATKAAIHSWSMSLRHQLAGTSVEVIEIAPPYVQTGLTGPHQHVDPAAMPLADFTTEVMAILADQPDAAEVIVGRCEPLRFAAERGTFQQMFDGVNAAH